LKQLLVVTEVYSPEDFKINDVVKYLSKNHKIIVITRAPSYPQGKLFPDYINSFNLSIENGVTIKRYPILLDYNTKKINKILNVIWQPFAVAFLVLTTKFDKVFVFQSGSIYSYSLLFGLRFRKIKSVLWSQDLWPEVGYESGLPKTRVLDIFLSFMTRFTLNNFDKVLSQNFDFKCYYASKYNVESDVLYNFSNINKKPLYTERENSNVLLYAGNIGVLQNLEEIINFYLKIQSQSSILCKFDIYGEGSSYHKFKEKYNGFNGITFHGMVSQEIITKELEKCRYAIFSLIKGPIRKTIPSRFQHLYNCNVPVIYIGNGATKHFIEKFNAGLVFDDDDDILNFINKIRTFELRKFQTNDVFNKNKILKQISNILNT
jgi:hypothetical protein